MGPEPEFSAERRFHKFGNALQVVSGASSALDLYCDELTRPDKKQMEGAITRGLADVEKLLDLGDGAGRVPDTPSSLRTAVDAAQARDADVRLEQDDVPALRDESDELATLLGELFVAVCPPTGSVTVGTSEAGEHVAIEIVMRREDNVRRLVVRVAGA